MMSIYLQMQDYLSKISDPVVFELGVHWAEDTARIMSYCKDEPRYFGFEPDSRNVAIIDKRKYNLPYPFTLIDGAISDTDGEQTLYLSDGTHPVNHNQMTGANSIREPFVVVDRFKWIDFSKTAKTKTYRLDTFCEKHKVKKIDFIWSDIQGSEYDMIMGAGEMINNISMMFLEYSNLELYKGQKNLKEILNLLGDKWHIVAQTPTDILVKQK